MGSTGSTLLAMMIGSSVIFTAICKPRTLQFLGLCLNVIGSTREKSTRDTASFTLASLSSGSDTLTPVLYVGDRTVLYSL